MQSSEEELERGGGGVRGHNSLFIHTQQLPGRGPQETNTGKEVESAALPPTLRRTQEVILGGVASELGFFLFFFKKRCTLSHSHAQTHAGALNPPLT